MVDGEHAILALVGELVELQYLINEASPVVLIQDITLLFSNGENVVNITANIGVTVTPSQVTYRIVGIGHSDEGNYTLVAVNAAGSSKATISIEVQGE